MATRITLIVDDELTEDEKGVLQYLLSDALHDFAAYRWPVSEYMDLRYPVVAGSAYPDGPRRIAKAEQVAARVSLARKLFGAAQAPVLETVGSSNLEYLTDLTRTTQDTTPCLYLDGGDHTCGRPSVDGTERCPHHTEAARP